MGEPAALAAKAKARLIAAHAAGDAVVRDEAAGRVTLTFHRAQSRLRRAEFIGSPARRIPGVGGEASYRP